MPTKATYALAKTLHHLKAAAFYFELTKVESKAVQEAKAFFNARITETNAITDRVIRNLRTQAMKDEINQDLQDPLALDAFTDGFIALTADNRLKVEEYMSNLLNVQ